MDLENEQKNRKTPEALFKPEKGIFYILLKSNFETKKNVVRITSNCLTGSFLPFFCYIKLANLIFICGFNICTRIIL